MAPMDLPPQPPNPSAYVSRSEGVAPSANDTQELTYEKVRAAVKRTQMDRPALVPLEEEGLPPVEATGTETVILNGEELMLSDSGELTPARVKAMLAQTSEHAKASIRTTRMANKRRSPTSRRFRRRKA